MKAVVAAFNQEKALVGAFSVIVQPVVEQMDRFAALIICPATLSIVNRGIYSDAYTTYYPLTSNPGNPGGTMMLTEEELQQRSVKASYVGGTNIDQRCQ